MEIIEIFYNYIIKYRKFLSFSETSVPAQGVFRLRSKTGVMTGLNRHTLLAFPSEPSFGASYFAMLRLSSRQALKALRNPLHNLPTNALRGPLQARHLHNAPPPPTMPPHSQVLHPMRPSLGAGLL